MSFEKLVEIGFPASLVAAISGFIGWRIGAAKDSIRIQHNSEQFQELARKHLEMERRLSGMERSEHNTDKQVAAALASVNTTLTHIAETLATFDRRMTALEGRLSRRDV